MSPTTLRRRMAGCFPLADHWSGPRKGTKAEKEPIVRFVLDLESQRFSPQIANMAAMADHILAAWVTRPVGEQWFFLRFVKRHTTLKLRFCCIENFPRALCENLNMLNAYWWPIQTLNTASRMAKFIISTKPVLQWARFTY